MGDMFEEDDDIVESDAIDIDVNEDAIKDARRRLEIKLDDMRLEAELKDDFTDY